MTQYSLHRQDGGLGPGSYPVTLPMGRDTIIKADSKGALDEGRGEGMDHFFNRILPDLYQCAMQPGQWRNLMDKIRAHFGVQNVSLQMYQVRDDHLRQQWSVRDSWSFSHRALHDRLVNNDRNPRLDLNLTARPQAGVCVLRDRDVFSPDCPEYIALRQRLHALGLGQELLLSLEYDSGRLLSLIMHKPAAERVDFTRAQERVLYDLAPHLQQAVESFENTLRLRQHVEMLSHTVGNLSTGLLLLDSVGKIRWSNHYARRILLRSSHLTLSRERVQCVSGETHAEFCRLLECAVRGEPNGRRGVMTVGNGTSRPLQLLVAPAYTPSLSDEVSMEKGVIVPVYLSERNDVLGLSPADVATLFGLTPAEARLATALTEGASLADYANEQGISVGTTRIQLKSVFSKTKTSRQSDLIKLLCMSVSAKASLP